MHNPPMVDVDDNYSQTLELRIAVEAATDAIPMQCGVCGLFSRSWADISSAYFAALIWLLLDVPVSN